eukprot:15014938-Ditylum_brightwellii.AAC.1
MSDNLDHCLNAVTVKVFTNKAYKLQKWYIQHMMHKPRHMSVHKWIARVVNLNNYLTDFLTPMGVKARKLEQEELLGVLENRIPTSWTFQMDKEDFDASSSTLKEFTEICVHYKECKLKMTEKKNTACKSHSEKKGKHKAKRKVDEKIYRKRGQDPPQCHKEGRGYWYCMYHGYCFHTTDECNITINWCKGCTHHENKERSHESKKVHFHSSKTKSHESLSNGSKVLNLIINEKITRLSAARKRQISTSLRPYPSCLQVMMVETVIRSPGSAIPLTNTWIWSETSAMGRLRKRIKGKGLEKSLM